MIYGLTWSGLYTVNITRHDSPYYKWLFLNKFRLADRFNHFLQHHKKRLRACHTKLGNLLVPPPHIVVVTKKGPKSMLPSTQLSLLQLRCESHALSGMNALLMLTQHYGKIIIIINRKLPAGMNMLTIHRIHYNKEREPQIARWNSRSSHPVWMFFTHYWPPRSVQVSSCCAPLLLIKEGCSEFLAIVGAAGVTETVGYNKPYCCWHWTRDPPWPGSSSS